MPSKLQIYSQMARDAAGTVNASVGQWTGFLTTAARLYKYPYEDQLMIFTQRPDATACAEYDLWNERMNRYVKRGARGIALIDSSGDYPRLRYVFDVSDTGTRRNSRPVYLWKMQDDYEAPVQSSLAKAFGVSESLPLESQLEQIANSLAVDYWQEHGQQFLDIVADSYLESYDEYNIEVAFRKAVAVSVTYQLYVRCLDDPASYFEHEDFLPIFDFNTRQTLNYLGAAVNGVSSQVFREIEVAIRTYERSRQAVERSQNHDERTDLHPERRLPDPEPRTDRAGAQAHGQVREDAQELPSGTQSDAVQRPGADRAAVPPSVGDSGDGHPANGTADGRTASEVSGTGQNDPTDGLGRTHEQPESDGRGDSADGAGVQLNPFGDTVPGEFEQLSFIFPTEAEQIEAIDHAAESEMPSAFSLPQSDIDQVLRLGGSDDASRMRVAAQFMMEKPTEEIAAFLKQEYRGGIGLNTDNGKMSAWFDERGV